MRIGMAAATSVIQCLPAGSTILLPDNLYFNVVQAMDLVYRPLGINYVQVRCCSALTVLMCAGGHD